MMKLNILLLSIFSFILAACGGGGGGSSKNSPAPTQDTQPKFSISGTISASANTVVDSDINDPFTDYRNNSTFATAQQLSNTASVQGFLTKDPTQFSGDVFESIEDVNDVYQVSLQAGQQVFMQVIDYSGFSQNSSRYSGDLDLALFNSNQELVSVSESDTEFEAITISAAGTYYVVPYAFSGTSKYILQIVTGSNSAVTSQVSADFVVGEAIVKMAQNSRQLSTNAILAASEMSHDRVTERAALAQFDKPNSDVNRLSITGQTTQEYTKLETLIRIKELRQSAGVEYAIPNHINRSMAVPNDEHYSLQWHYPSINLPQAWDITTGVAENNREIIVAVIDTGVVLGHPDFEGKLVPGFDFISDPDTALDGDGIDNNPDDPGDLVRPGRSSWHGTHVAGTVAAKTNNNIGVAGVSWGAKIMPIRVLGKNGGATYDTLQGVLFAAGLPNDSNTVPSQKADIINLSLGGSPYHAEIQKIYKQVYDNGVIIVAAAGNKNTSTLAYPASYEGVISVSALDFKNNKSSYSNYGSAVDISAPGGDMRADLNGDGRPDGVWSPVVVESGSQLRVAYGLKAGTSMAAPHVAGMIALMKAVYPALTPKDVDNLLAAGDLTQEAGDPGRDDIHGYGRADALRAVQAAQKLADGGTTPTPTPAIVASPSSLTVATQNAGILTLSNSGGGTPSLIGIVENASWLTVSADQVNTQGLGTYTVTIDRAGLSPGVYTEKVVFNFSDNISLQVNVSMTVGATQTDGQLAQLYPLLYDPTANGGEGAVVAQASTTNLNRGQVAYTFSDITPGNYYVFAGTDIDNDGDICQIGEGCGAFPSFNKLDTVSVQDKNIINLDFVVDLMASLSSMAVLSSGDDTVDKQLLELKRLDK